MRPDTSQVYIRMLIQSGVSDRSLCDRANSSDDHIFGSMLPGRQCRPRDISFKTAQRSGNSTRSLSLLQRGAGQESIPQLKNTAIGERVQCLHLRCSAPIDTECVPVHPSACPFNTSTLTRLTTTSTPPLQNTGSFAHVDETTPQTPLESDRT